MSETEQKKFVEQMAPWTEIVSEVAHKYNLTYQDAVLTLIWKDLNISVQLQEVSKQ